MKVIEYSEIKLEETARMTPELERKIWRCKEQRKHTCKEEEVKIKKNDFTPFK